MKTPKIKLSVLALLIGGTIQAQTCQSTFATAQSAFSSVLVEYQEFRKEACRLLLSEPMADVGAIALDFQTKLYFAAGELTGNGQTSLGPRNLYIPCKNISGNLVAGVGTERTFITVPSIYDKTFITIKQTDGNSSAKVAVCVKTSDGTVVNKKDKEIDGKGKEIEFVFFNTEDKYMSIHLVKPLGLNNFTYTVSIRGEMNLGKPDMLEYIKEIEAEEAKESAKSTPKPKKEFEIPETKTGNQGTGKDIILKDGSKPTVVVPKQTTATKGEKSTVIVPKVTTTPEGEPSTEAAPSGETQEEMEARLKKEANEKAKEKAKEREEERLREEKKEEMKAKAKAKAKAKQGGGQ